MQRTSMLLVALTALVGCGNFWTSNTVDLAAVEGAPVKISQVKMRHSRMIGLSSTPATFSSGDGPNAVGVEFSVDKVSETPPHAGVAARLSCRVGDRVVVAPVAHDASNRLASLAAVPTSRVFALGAPRPISRRGGPPQRLVIATAQTPDERRAELQNIPAVTTRLGKAPPKEKKGILSRLFGK